MKELTKIIHQIFKENAKRKMSFSEVLLYYDENKKLPFGNSEVSMFDVKNSIVELHDKGIIARSSYEKDAHVSYYLE